MGPIVVIGGTGMLGQALLRVLESRSVAFLAPTRAELDLCDSDRLARRLRRLGPSAVINVSAYSDVGRAESEPHRAEAFRVNRDGPRDLARACVDGSIPLVHVSTDYVFDGAASRPYRETDRVAALQVYGQSKLEGEIAVREIDPRALVVRTSTLYGPGVRIRAHYVDAILHQAREKSRLEVVRLPVSSPTFTDDLATALLELRQVGAEGLVHFANRGECSRLDLARAVVRLAGLGDRVEVRERPEPAGTLFRPAYSVLDTTRFVEWTGCAVRNWEEALQEYLNRWAS